MILTFCIDVKNIKTMGSNFLFLVVCYFLISETIADSTCIPSKTSYYLGTTKVTWQDAVKQCQAVAGSLVSIQTKPKSDEIYKFLLKNGVNFSGTTPKGGFEGIWTSGNRLLDKKTFRWLRQEPFVCTQWASTDPNNWGGHEECVTLVNDGTSGVWMDIECSNKLYPLCELPTCCLDHDYCSINSKPKFSYSVVSTKVNWNDALQACRALGANLASIQNKEKSDAIYNSIQVTGKYSEVNEALWTSGNRLQDKVHWYWLAQEPITYTNWAVSEPNNYQGKEECISWLNNGTTSIWNDIACDVKLYPLCEKLMCCLDNGCSNQSLPSTLTCNCNCGQCDRSPHL